MDKATLDQMIAEQKTVVEKLKARYDTTLRLWQEAFDRQCRAKDRLVKLDAELLRRREHREVLETKLKGEEARLAVLEEATK